MTTTPGKVKMIDSDREIELRNAIEGFYFGFRAFTALPDRMLEERGLSRTHHRILYFVQRDPGIRIGSLIDLLGITKQAAHAPLRQLHHQGLLTSAAAATDQRARELRLTKAGRALEAELTAVQMRVLNDAFGVAGQNAEAGWRGVMAALASPPSQRT